MKISTNKQLRAALEKVVLELNHNLIRIDKTLSTIQVVRQFAHIDCDDSSSVPDAIHGIQFLILDTMSELENLRDNIEFDLKENQ